MQPESLNPEKEDSRRHRTEETPHQLA